MNDWGYFINFWDEEMSGLLFYWATPIKIMEDADGLPRCAPNNPKGDTIKDAPQSRNRGALDIARDLAWWALKEL